VEQRYFILIPASGSVKRDFIPVDPATLHLGIITEIWTLGDRGQKVRAHGAENAVTTGLDITALLEMWGQIESQMQSSFSAEKGKASEVAADLLGSLRKLPEILELLASGQLVAATAALEGFGYGLLTAGSNAVASLQEAENRLESSGGTVESFVKQIGILDQGELFKRKLDSWTEDYETFLSLIIALDENEKELRRLIGALSEDTAVWVAQSEGTDPHLQATLEALGDGEHGLAARINRFLIEKEAGDVAAITARIAHARSEIAKWHSAIDDSLTMREMWLEDAKPHLDQRFEVSDRSIGRLSILLEALDRHEQESPDGLSADEALIGRIQPDQLQLADKHRASGPWSSSFDAKQRFVELYSAIDRLLAVEPKLTEKAVRVFERAEHQIERAEALILELTQGPLGEPAPPTEPEAAKPAPAPKAASKVESPSATNGKKPRAVRPNKTAAQASKRRLEEIYEMLLAVGAVAYCGTRQAYSTMGTIASLMGILQRVGAITEAEADEHKASLQAMLDRKSHNMVEKPLDTSRNDGGRIQAWEELPCSDVHWIKFQQGRGKSKVKFWYVRLLSSARELGLEMCTKYNLDPEDIRDARSARQGDWEQRKLKQRT
jgi:hypothetical protein